MFFFLFHIFFYKGRNKHFVGSAKNGITSIDYPPSFDSMTLVDCDDIPFPIYMDMSCGYVEIFHCVGLENGCKFLKVNNSASAIYGSNPYSTDSNICKASLHSGCIGPKGGFCLKYPVGMVRIFRGTIRNGISTTNYVNYFEGFQLANLTDELEKFVKDKKLSTDYCGRNERNSLLYCLGKNNGCLDEYSTWGSNPYTFDSSACVSALHAGVIGLNGGIFSVDGVNLYDGFKGSMKNQINSQDWNFYILE